MIKYLIAEDGMYLGNAIYPEPGQRWVAAGWSGPVYDPVYQGGQHNAETGEVSGGAWVSTGAPPDDWPSVIAARRYQAETAGTTVGGVAINTERDSQALMTGAAVQAMLDPGYQLQWKTPAGFVQLSAQQILAVAQASRAHVQACFDREAELLSALDAGTFQAGMLEEGWPAAS
ncbi:MULTISPECIES: DUF4376 domain-containing protein [unclassified Pseudomonas]|uniref:DUF4376 domain-containing protein n=1 Tax=unclassified Pseudomonas TaxID=196821 RepID=UPI002447B043|nr:MULTISPECIES: DUF4376 domain-containing protein [unclassified Pseudomonas]MDG9928547.1 DUF4376 domain-containing protein [Pseudomonas sp. GD04042]MDH0482717.1 DUF4376 domain-containing protein [Pseudomonas sp. GD04015]MDH0604581.1 DUF4376 domain-containing protein [Pseudomonas sp. GD03869]